MVLIIGSVSYIAVTGGPDSETATRSPQDPPTTTPAPSTSAPATTAPGTSGPDATTSTTTTTAPPSTTNEEEFLALVRELQSAVEQARQHTFARDVTVELENNADFEARLLEGFEEEVEEFENAEVFYRALGLLDSEEPLEELVRGIYTQGVLGYYDPETDELVVRGTEPTPYVQQTIVHELVHALDDQLFELHRPRYDDRKDEIWSGFSAVVEGNARRIEDEWMADQPDEFRNQAAREEEEFGANLDLSGFPEILLNEIAAPYQFGQTFVQDLTDESGERGVDGALTDPPDTSEQYLYPELYETRQPRVEVPPPPADGDIVDDGVVGALFLFLMLADSSSPVNQLDASRAIDGWGGDWFVSWRDGDANCVRADFVGDTDGDTDEIRDALESWTEGRGYGQVSDVDGRVRLESCVVGGGGTPRV